MSRATDSFIAGIVRSHRFVFIAATAVLAIGTSRVAVDVGEWRSWLLTLGAALLMYVSDQCGEIEEKSRDLARTTGRPASKARADVFRSDAPRGTSLGLGIGLILLLAGFAGAAFS
jgi:hypothetical protein